MQCIRYRNFKLIMARSLRVFYFWSQQIYDIKSSKTINLPVKKGIRQNLPIFIDKALT